MKTVLLVLFFAMFSPLHAEVASDVTVSVETPHPGFVLKILRVDRSETGLTVLAEATLPNPDQMYPSVISSASATAIIQGKGGPAKLYLLNRRWGWGDDPVVKNEAEYVKAIGTATPVPFKQE